MAGIAKIHSQMAIRLRNDLGYAAALGSTQPQKGAPGRHQQGQF